MVASSETGGRPVATQPRIQQAGISMHTRMVHNVSIKWCMKVYAGVVSKHDQERVPQDEVDAGIAIDSMSYGSLRFLSRILRRSQLS